MIIVTGATGQLGAAITARLVGRVPAVEVGVSVRDPEQARPLADRGVRVRHGDFDDPATLPHALEGATQVLIVSTPVVGERKRRQHRAAIDAAVAAGAERIVYTSHMASSRTSRFVAMHDHAATEEMLGRSGVAVTSLRNGYYAAGVGSAMTFMGPALETGQLIVPEDGPVSWTAHADLAEAAVIALTEPERLNGLTPPLTGRDAIDFGGIAEIASELTGRRIDRVTVSDDEYRALLVSRGMSEPDAEMLTTVFAACREGEFAAVDPTLADLLGRPAMSMREVLGAELSNREAIT